MDGSCRRQALQTLLHPDQAVAHLAATGVTMVAADATMVTAMAEALERSLAWRLPDLYVTIDDDDDRAELSFRLVPVNGSRAVIDDDALVELATRLENVRDAVPATIMDLIDGLNETTAAVEAAEQRRDHLKEILTGQARTLAGTPDARAIVGIYRRMAHLELDRGLQPGVQLGVMQAAYEDLVGLDVTSLPLDPEATALAARWDRLVADEARLDATEPAHPLTDQLELMEQKLTVAEEVLAAAQAEVDRPRPTNADRDEIERLHTAAEAMAERTPRSGKREARSGLDGALAAEAAFLTRFGFGSYSDYLLDGALDPPVAVKARCDAAAQKVASLQTIVDELRSHMTPSAARRSLLERSDQLAMEISSRYPELDLGDDDVSDALRSIRLPPPAWADLLGALAANGYGPVDDPLALAYEVLAEAAAVTAAADVMEQELAELRAHLATIDGEILARYRPLGVVAAELVKVEQVHEQLKVEVVELRAELGAELEQDPSLRPMLDEMQLVDRQLSELAQRLRADDEGDGGPMFAEHLDKALAAAAVFEPSEGPLDPLMVVFDGAAEGPTGDRADRTACLDRLLDASIGRQVVAITADATLADLATSRPGVTLTTFTPS